MNTYIQAGDQALHLSYTLDNSSEPPYRHRHIRPHNLGPRVRLRVADCHLGEIVHGILAQGLDRLRIDEEAPKLDAAGALELGLGLARREEGRVA